MVEYKNLLVNEKSARIFLEELLPELKNDEVFIIVIFSRKKYNKISTDEWMFSRKIIKEKNIDQIINKIKRMGIFSDNFIDFKTNEIIPIDAFVCYIDLAPKSTLKAFNIFTKKMDEWLYQIVKENFMVDKFKKIQNILMSSVHKANSYKPYIIIDIDKKDDKEILSYVLGKLNNNYKWITETRGGYHIIIDKTKDICKIIYNEIIKPKKESIFYSYLDFIEIKSKTLMTPIVGTLQGGFEVKKYKI